MRKAFFQSGVWTLPASKGIRCIFQNQFFWLKSDWDENRIRINFRRRSSI